MGQEHGAILSISPCEVRLDFKKIYCIRFFFCLFVFFFLTNLLSLNSCPLILRNFQDLKNHLLSFDACCFPFLKKQNKTNKKKLILFLLEDNCFAILCVCVCVCVLSYINMNHPRLHMCPPRLNPHSPPSLPHSSGLSQNTDFEYPASCIELALVISFTYGNIYVSMIFSQIILPSPTPKSPKVYSLYLSLFCCLAYKNANTIFLNPICCCCC